MYDWQSAGYKRERDKARSELRDVQYKLDTQTAMLEKIVAMVNNSCDGEVLTSEDFMYYFEHAIESDEDIFAEQFTTLMMSAKIFFGEELHKIRIDEERTAEKYRESARKIHKDREQSKKEYGQLLEIRGNERELSIKKREALLGRIFIRHSTLDDLPDEDIPHARALIESGHLKATYWLGRLRILKREDIPPENKKEYYECQDHKGCPHSGDFYAIMARIASL